MFKKSFIIFFVIIIFQQYSFAQEVGISVFFQEDLLYNTRPGVSVSYTKNFNNIFSLEFEYGNQYIKQTYTTSNFYFNSKVNAKVFMNNLSVSPLISIVNKKRFTFQIGSKHTLFFVAGKENVHQTTYDFVNDTTINLIENDYTRNPLKPYYSYSNEFKFKFKEIFIPQVSIIINLSAGYIFNGSRFSGCVVMPTDIFAPYGRINLGISYKFKK